MLSITDICDEKENEFSIKKRYRRTRVIEFINQ